MPLLSKSLRYKMMAGSSLAVLALVLLPIVYTWSALDQSSTFRQVRHTIAVIAVAQEVIVDLRELQLAEVGAASAGREEFAPAMSTLGGRLRSHLDELRREVADDPEQSDRAARIAEQVRAWLDSMAPGGPPGPVDEAGLAPLVRGEHGALQVADIVYRVREVLDSERELLRQRTDRNTAARYRNIAIVLIGSSLAILTFLSLMLWLSRRIVDPVRELTDATSRLQEGDLRVRVTARGEDELGQLGHGFNAMAASLQRNARELEKRDVQAGVLQVAQVLATSSDLPHLLDRALEQILEVTHCPAGAIWVRSTEDEGLRALVAIGTGEGLTDQVVHPGEGVLGRVAQTRVAYFAPADSEAAPLTIQHWLGPRRPAELAYVPLTSGTELVGVLTLAAVEPLDDRSKNLLRIVSGQLGAAIRDALMHQLLRRQAVELRATNDRLAEHQAEIQRQNRELRVASQLKSEFLANMSHELRTPLTIILGFTNTVLRGAQGELSEPQKDSLRRVYDNAKHLLGLINDILDLSKIEAGQMEIESEPFLLAPALEAIADNFGPMAEAKGLALRLDLGADLPGEVVGDETRFRQVVTNLVSNAVKFTERGEVVVAARRDGPAAIEVEVRDTGPGIAEEDLPKVFDQFRQLDGATTRKSGGTGLGLSIVKRLVELMGGSLEVRSRVGKGSTFLVRLPLEPSPAAEPRPASPPTPRPDPRPEPTRARLVLAIDDDEDFLTLLRAACQDSPFALRCASSGPEGLDLARQLRPDAITLDVMMPEMDGWRVLSELKSDARTADIPVILLTVLQRRGLGLMLGASEYLTKPIDRDRLLRALRQYAPSRPEDGGTILVVDDDPDVRRMLEVELAAVGLGRVETAADGVEGLRLARERRPDLIVLDLMMPNMDGFEMAARLQEDDATRGIPVIVLTAKDLTSDDYRRLNGSIEHVLQKGALSVDALIERLLSILRSLGVRTA